jgi:hypothetical protein
MTVNISKLVFWDMISCSLVGVYQPSVNIFMAGVPEDGSNRFLQKADNHLRLHVNSERHNVKKEHLQNFRERVHIF